jgi:hypothetical protein
MMQFCYIYLDSTCTFGNHFLQHRQYCDIGHTKKTPGYMPGAAAAETRSPSGQVSGAIGTPTASVPVTSNPNFR